MKMQNMRGWGRFIPFLMIAVGVAVVAFALGIDLLKMGGQSGIGIRQVLLASSGGILLLAGLFLASPLGSRLVHNLVSAEGMEAQPVSIFLLAIWFGLLTGFGEGTILVLQKLLRNKILLRSQHFGWMLPVGDSVIFLGLAVILFLLLGRKKARAIGIVIFLFTFVGLVSWLFLFPRIHAYATLILTAGIALQGARLVARYRGGFYWLVRRSLPVLLVLLGLVAGGSYGRQAWMERRALAALPASRADAPNVLLITLDTVRAQNLGLYGYSRNTSPFLDQLAKQGVRFDRAFSTAPWTLPSHASMFTGRWPHELSVDWVSPLDGKYSTLAEVLSAQGYATAGFIANTEYCSWEFGLSRGFSHYEDHLVSPGQILATTSLVRYSEEKFRPYIGPNRMLLPKTAEIVNTSFLRWLSHRPDRPFFVFLNYMDAHEPYQPPKPYDRMFGPPGRRANPYALPHSQWSPEQVQADVDAYDGGIAYLDAQLGRLFASLKAQGVLENTLVIIAADHGEEFGEHQDFGHGNSLYAQAIHVPLLILFPGRILPGSRIGDSVSLRDLPATILELTGTEGASPLPGTSLARYWEAAKAATTPEKNDLVLSELGSQPENNPVWFPTRKGSMRSLVNNSYHYILDGNGVEELYDIQVDSAEQQDLYHRLNGSQVLNQFRSEYNHLFPPKQSLYNKFFRFGN